MQVGVNSFYKCLIVCPITFFVQCIGNRIVLSTMTKDCISMNGLIRDRIELSLNMLKP
jgi:hypothetical protein